MAIRSRVVDVNLKRMFFDTKLVARLIGKDSANALGKAAARVRLRAMHSMKKRGAARRPPKNQGGRAYRRWEQEVIEQKPSPAGKPPYVWSDHHVRTLRNIWFALDTSTVSHGDLSAVVGPLGLNQRITGSRNTVPELHEMGGTAVVREWNFKHRGRSQWLPGKGPRRSNVVRRQRQAKYPARPFMFPALQAEAPKFPTLWTGRAA